MDDNSFHTSHSGLNSKPSTNEFGGEGMSTPKKRGAKPGLSKVREESKESVPFKAKGYSAESEKSSANKAKGVATECAVSSAGKTKGRTKKSVESLAEKAKDKGETVESTKAGVKVKDSSVKQAETNVKPTAKVAVEKESASNQTVKKSDSPKPTTVTAKPSDAMAQYQANVARSKNHATFMEDDNPYWFLLRDLRRANSLEHGYQALEKNGMRVFTPLEWRIKKTPSKQVRVLVPVMPDLLFVYGTYREVSRQVAIIPRIQFRYLKGKGFMEPTTIPTEEMEYFINAVSNTEEPKYYLPGEITPGDIGRKVRIIGGALNGYTGRLLKWKGSKKKALIIEIKNYLVGTVTVEPEMIEYVDE